MKDKRTKEMTIRIFTIGIILLSLFKVEAANSTFNTSPHDSLLVTVPNVFTPNSDGVNDTSISYCKIMVCL